MVCFARVLPVRIFLVLSALVWLPYGLFCLFQPQYLAEAAGVAYRTATGATEIRAMYGGLQTAIGALALAAVFRPGLERVALVTLAFLCAGLGSARLLGVALDGDLSTYTAIGLGFEFGSLALALACLKLGARPLPA